MPNEMCGALERDGYCILPAAIASERISELLALCEDAFTDEKQSVRARSSRGHVYAARNLMDSIPHVATIWHEPALLAFLSSVLGEDFGLVRALFFDKPPDRTWNLPWHRDTSIAVIDNSIESEFFSRPTMKAGVPHLIAHDDVLRSMLTLRIHLDQVTDENGPLRVIPGSHVSSQCDGQGVDDAVTIHASVGDVLAMRPLIQHSSGSSVIGTKRHRRILHLEFAAGRPLPDGALWHRFVASPGVASSSTNTVATQRI